MTWGNDLEETDKEEKSGFFRQLILIATCIIIFSLGVSFFEWSIEEFKCSAYFGKWHSQSMTISDVGHYLTWIFHWPLRSIETPQIAHFFELDYPYTGSCANILSFILWSVTLSALALFINVLILVYCESIEKFKETKKTLLDRWKN